MSAVQSLPGASSSAGHGCPHEEVGVGLRVGEVLESEVETALGGHVEGFGQSHDQAVVALVGLASHERVLAAAELEDDSSSPPLVSLDWKGGVHLLILEASGLHQLLVCREALIGEELALYSLRGRLTVLGRLGLETCVRRAGGLAGHVRELERRVRELREVGLLGVLRVRVVVVADHDVGIFFVSIFVITRSRIGLPGPCVLLEGEVRVPEDANFANTVYRK